MLGTVENMQVGQLQRTKLVLGQHTLYNLDEQGVLALHCNLEGLLHQVAGGVGALAAGVTGETQVLALLHLATVQFDLVGVDDDHIVTAIHIGGVTRLVLATKYLGHLRAEAAQNHIGRIDQHPLLLDRGGCCALRSVT